MTNLETKDQPVEQMKPIESKLVEFDTSSLEAANKRIKILAAENTRLNFQITTDRAHFETERKASKRTADDKKMEIERLEADVHRLATKLSANPHFAAANNPFASPSPQAVAPLKTQTEQPNNIVIRAAPFDYSVTPNPSSPNAALQAAERRIASLEEYNKMLTLLLEQGANHRKNPAIRATLLEKGLYAAKPFRAYVQPDYWRDVIEFWNGIDGMPEEVAAKMLAGSSMVEPAEEMIVDYDECF
jgi:hypothetical protein